MKKMLNDGDPTLLPSASTHCHRAPAKPQPDAEDLDGPLCIILSPTYLALQLEREGELVVLLGSELFLQLQQLLLQPQLLLLQMCHGGHHLLDHGEGPGHGQAGTFSTAEPPSCSMSKDGAGQDTATSLGSRMTAMGSPQGLSCRWERRKLDLHRCQRVQ